MNIIKELILEQMDAPQKIYSMKSVVYMLLMKVRHLIY